MTLEIHTGKKISQKVTNATETLQLVYNNNPEYRKWYDGLSEDEKITEGFRFLQAETWDNVSDEWLKAIASMPAID